MNGAQAGAIPGREFRHVVTSPAAVPALMKRRRETLFFISAFSQLKRYSHAGSVWKRSEQQGSPDFNIAACDVPLA